MQTKHFMNEAADGPERQPSTPPQPPIGRPAPAATSEVLAALREVLLVEIVRLKLIVFSLPRDEQIVIRALHGLGCGQFSPEEIAARMKIGVTDVRAIEERAMARIRFFYELDRAA